jgi:hypothetical protein
VVKQRMRRGEPALPDTATVVRGGDLEPGTLRTNTRVNYAAYGFHGISLWAVTDAYPLALLAAGKLRGARTLVIFSVGDLRAAGLDLWDTGQSPHFDVIYGDGSDPEALISRLHRLPQRIMDNEHYEPEGAPP